MRVSNRTSDSGACPLSCGKAVAILMITSIALAALLTGTLALYYPQMNIESISLGVFTKWPAIGMIAGGSLMLVVEMILCLKCWLPEERSPLKHQEGPPSTSSPRGPEKVPAASTPTKVVLQPVVLRKIALKELSEAEVEMALKSFEKGLLTLDCEESYAARKQLKDGQMIVYKNSGALRTLEIVTKKATELSPNIIYCTQPDVKNVGESWAPNLVQDEYASPLTKATLMQIMQKCLKEGFKLCALVPAN